MQFDANTMLLVFIKFRTNLLFRTYCMTNCIDQCSRQLLNSCCR